jgi:hypothetical protein
MRWTTEGIVPRPQYLAPTMVRGGGWDLERTNGRAARRVRRSRGVVRTEAITAAVAVAVTAVRGAAANGLEWLAGIVRGGHADSTAR